MLLAPLIYPPHWNASLLTSVAHTTHKSCGSGRFNI